MLDHHSSRARAGSCSARAGSRSPRAGPRSPQAGSRSPQASSRSPQAGSRSPRPLVRGGFTILELLIVLILIALVASFSISAFFDRSEVTLENAVKLLAEDLHLAQSRAAYLQEPVECVVAEDGDGYSFVDTGRSDAAHSSVYPLPLRRYSVDAVFEGVRIDGRELGSSRRIRFDEKGHAQASGAVTLSYRGDSRRVEIEAGQGRVRFPDTQPKRSWLERFR